MVANHREGKPQPIPVDRKSPCVIYVGRLLSNPSIRGQCSNKTVRVGFANGQVSHSERLCF